MIIDPETLGRDFSFAILNTNADNPIVVELKNKILISLGRLVVSQYPVGIWSYYLIRA